MGAVPGVTKVMDVNKLMTCNFCLAPWKCGALNIVAIAVLRSQGDSGIRAERERNAATEQGRAEPVLR